MSIQLHIRDAFGTMLTSMADYVRLEYIRSEGKVGWLQLDLDPSAVDERIWRLDNRIEPWRQVGANTPYLDGETVFFVRQWGWKIDQAGREVYRIKAYDPNFILSGRIDAYPSGNDAARIIATKADNAIKDVISDNLGATSTDTARNMASFMTIAGDLGLGPNIDKEFSHRVILDVLQEICENSKQAGTYLTWDIVYTSPTMLEFRTYTGQRGLDHGSTSGQPVIVSRNARNLEEPEAYEDHSNEYTYIYAGGQGVGVSRVEKTAASNNQYLSPFNRRELWIDARQSSLDDSVTAEAKAGLSANAYKQVFAGRIIDTDGCQYGVHYRFGDIVWAEYRGKGYSAHISTIHVTMEEGRETFENLLSVEVL
jgi:hypothetical protein